MVKGLLLVGLLAVLTGVAFAVSLPLPPNGDPMDHMSQMVSFYDNRLFSEFNHKLVGVYLALVGMMVLAWRLDSEQTKWLRSVWPLLFIAPGIYLLVKSDPDGWPVGASLGQSLGNIEWYQHKIFALLLIMLGGVELRRIEDEPAGKWWAAGFGVLALVGVGLTLVHHHEEGHMETMMGMDPGSMARIQAQHIGFAVVGAAMVAARWLSGSGRWKWRYARLVWPSLLILLSMQLILYRE